MSWSRPDIVVRQVNLPGSVVHPKFKLIHQFVFVQVEASPEVKRKNPDAELPGPSVVAQWRGTFLSIETIKDAPWDIF